MIRVPFLRAFLLPLFLFTFQTVCPELASAQSGIWTSAKELAALPLDSPGYRAVLSDANGDTSNPDVANQDDPTNVRVFAAALVYARTGDTRYRDKVVAAIEKLVAKGAPGGRTLAWGRETGAYALAADLVGYRTPAFETWLRNMAEVYRCEQLNTSLLGMFVHRPSNWGSHAFGSLAAIYAYLGDRTKLQFIRQYWIDTVNGIKVEVEVFPGEIESASFGELSWQVDPKKPRWINPSGARASNGMLIDGILPDDMRRGGTLQEPPIPTGYMWEGQQGFLLAGRVLDRAGLSIYAVSDAAIFRAAHILQVVYAANYGPAFKASGDDLWMLRFYNSVYDAKFDVGASDGWGAGKNIGYPWALTDGGTVTPPTPTPTQTPRPSPSATPTVIPTATPKPSPSPTATPKPSATPTSTPTPSPSATPTVVPTATATPSPSPTKPPGRKKTELSYTIAKRKVYFTAIVVDENGAPVAGERVALERNLNRKTSPWRVVREAVTDADGKAEFKRMERGSAKSTYRSNASGLISTPIPVR